MKRAFLEENAGSHTSSPGKKALGGVKDNVASLVSAIVDREIQSMVAEIVDQFREAAARYVKIVEWSDEDQCFVGSCPGLFYGGCHGEDEKSVFAELCQIVEETVKLSEADSRPLPPATSGSDWANTIVNTTTTG